MIDKLFNKVKENGVVCVGLDTSMDYIPETILNNGRSPENALFNFNKKIIDSTKDIVACYKVQIAYYEAYGIEGLMAYKKTLAYLRDEGLITIADIKRGDISATGKMYAKAHFEGDFEADFLTVNPYMGLDSIEPFLENVEKNKKALFILMKTSNPGARDFEYLESQGKPIYYHVGDRVLEISNKFIGKSGYSRIGFVAGGTDAKDAKEIRERYENSFLLVPGYGAQGGKAEDIKAYLKEGNGAIVNSSRGIIAAHLKEETKLEFDELAREKALIMRKDLEYEGNI